MKAVSRPGRVPRSTIRFAPRSSRRPEPREDPPRELRSFDCLRAVLRAFSASMDGHAWRIGILAVVWSGVVGCDPGPNRVTLYAAQDRVFAEPILREFEAASGFRVAALYDSESTKTVGLANRLIAEAARPLADVWWSNEEMRTRQLAAKGVLEGGWSSFGERRRVFVVRNDSEWASASAPASASPSPTRGTGLSLAALTNATWRGRVAMAYPLFGSTTTHFLALRQRWGEEAWRTWCGSLAANRPWLVDGNSVVVRLVAKGDADLGLTDSDDVAFAKREGLEVESIDLAPGEGLSIPNTVAYVAGSGRREAAVELASYLTAPDVARRLATTGALDESAPGGGGNREALTEREWSGLIQDLDASIEWLKGVFIR